MVALVSVSVSVMGRSKVLTIETISSWSLDKCNEELGAACHYSLHNDLSEAREACIEMAREMGMLPKKQIRIREAHGQYIVEAMDNNGVWVLTEPGQCSFGDRDEAQDYVDGWINSTVNMVQVADAG